eukprot:scaffold301533_cov32-Tisochrysis_lutea.AAC.1
MGMYNVEKPFLRFYCRPVTGRSHAFYEYFPAFPLPLLYLVSRVSSLHWKYEMQRGGEEGSKYGK